MSRACLIAVALAIAGAALVARQCWFTPEARVERAVSQAVKAVERENLDGVLAFVDDSFSDAVGLDRAEWTRLLQDVWTKWKDIDIRLVQPTVVVNGREATVHCHALIDATAAATMGPGKTPDRQSGGRENLEMRLREIDGRWRLVGMGGATPGEWAR
jgi:hypothetical protein